MTISQSPSGAYEVASPERAKGGGCGSRGDRERGRRGGGKQQSAAEVAVAADKRHLSAAVAPVAGAMVWTEAR